MKKKKWEETKNKLKLEKILVLKIPKLWLSLRVGIIERRNKIQIKPRIEFVHQQTPTLTNRDLPGTGSRPLCPDQIPDAESRSGYFSVFVNISLTQGQEPAQNPYLKVLNNNQAFYSKISYLN